MLFPFLLGFTLYSYHFRIYLYFVVREKNDFMPQFVSPAVAFFCWCAHSDKAFHQIKLIKNSPVDVF